MDVYRKIFRQLKTSPTFFNDNYLRSYEDGFDWETEYLLNIYKYFERMNEVDLAKSLVKLEVLLRTRTLYQSSGLRILQKEFGGLERSDPLSYCYPKELFLASEFRREHLLSYAQTLRREHEATVIFFLNWLWQFFRLSLVLFAVPC